MNVTTQLLAHFRTQTSSAPSLEFIITNALLMLLRMVRSLLLLYPINILFIFCCLFGLLYWGLGWCIGDRKKSMVYWPKPHHEAHDQHVRNFKKDIRDLQNESISLGRKHEMMVAEAKNKEHQQADSSIEHIRRDSTQGVAEEVIGLLEERQYIKEVSKELIGEIRMSQVQILNKLKKYSK